METEIKQWGNSAAVRIPAKLLAIAGLSISSKVEMEANKGQIALKAAVKPRYTLDELLKASPAGSLELDDNDVAWLNDSPKGDEVW